MSILTSDNFVTVDTFLGPVKFARGTPDYDRAVRLANRQPMQFSKNGLSHEDGRSLAEYYAARFNAMGDYFDFREFGHAAEELAHSDWTVFRAPDGTWHARHVDDVSQYGRRGLALQYAAARAPKGGMNVQGRKYRGGMWIPAAVMAQASPAEKAALEDQSAHHDEAKLKRGQARAAAGVDVEALQGHLKEHARELSPAEQTRAKKVHAALKQHHGEQTLHRIGELVDADRKALAHAKSLGVTEGAHVDFLKKSLAGHAHMLKTHVEKHPEHVEKAKAARTKALGEKAAEAPPPAGTPVSKPTPKPQTPMPAQAPVPKPAAPPNVKPKLPPAPVGAPYAAPGEERPTIPHEHPYTPPHPAPGSKAEPEAKAKEPHEMTKDEWGEKKGAALGNDIMRGNRGGESKGGLDPEGLGYHHEHIAKAISEGKPVPPEVLKDYPELAAAAEKKADTERKFPARVPMEPSVLDKPGTPPVPNLPTKARLDQPKGTTFGPPNEKTPKNQPVPTNKPWEPSILTGGTPSAEVAKAVAEKKADVEAKRPEADAPKISREGETPNPLPNAAGESQKSAQPALGEGAAPEPEGVVKLRSMAKAAKGHEKELYERVADGEDPKEVAVDLITKGMPPKAAQAARSYAEKKVEGVPRKEKAGRGINIDKLAQGLSHLPLVKDFQEGRKQGKAIAGALGGERVGTDIPAKAAEIQAAVAAKEITPKEGLKQLTSLEKGETPKLPEKRSAAESQLEDALKQARQTDKQFGGGGRYEAEVYKKMNGESMPGVKLSPAGQSYYDDIKEPTAKPATGERLDELFAKGGPIEQAEEEVKKQKTQFDFGHSIHHNHGDGGGFVITTPDYSKGGRAVAKHGPYPTEKEAEDAYNDLRDAHLKPFKDKANALRSERDSLVKEERANEPPPIDLGGFNPANLVKIAADSIEQLRKQDVGRLIDSAGPKNEKAMAKYILDHRPELSGDVHDALIDAESERTQPAQSTAAIQPDDEARLKRLTPDQLAKEAAVAKHMGNESKQQAIAELQTPENYPVKSKSVDIAFLMGSGRVNTDVENRVFAALGTDDFASFNKAMKTATPEQVDAAWRIVKQTPAGQSLAGPKVPEKQTATKIEREGEDVRATIALPDGETFKGKWRTETGKSDDELKLLALKEYGEKLALADTGHGSHAEATAAGKIVDEKKRAARKAVAADMRPEGRPEVVADYEEMSGYKREYRIEPHYSPVNGVYFQAVYDVPEKGIHGEEMGPKHESYDDAATEIGMHLERLRDPSVIHDPKVQESHDRAREMKSSKAQAETEAKNKEETESNEKRRANAEAKVALDELIGKVPGKKGTAQITVGAAGKQATKKEVQGTIIGPFIIHKDEPTSKKDKNKYTVTHIASGLKAPGEFTSVEDARKMAILLGRHGRWDKEKLDSETTNYASNVYRSWKNGDYAELLKHIQEHDKKKATVESSPIVPLPPVPAEPVGATASTAGKNLTGMHKEDFDSHKPILEKHLANETSVRRKVNAADAVMNNLPPAVQKSLAEHLAFIAPDAYDAMRERKNLAIAPGTFDRTAEEITGTPAVKTEPVVPPEIAAVAKAKEADYDKKMGKAETKAAEPVVESKPLPEPTAIANYDRPDLAKAIYAAAKDGITADKMEANLRAAGLDFTTEEGAKMVMAMRWDGLLRKKGQKVFATTHGDEGEHADLNRRLRSSREPANENKEPVLDADSAARRWLALDQEKKGKYRDTEMFLIERAFPNIKEHAKVVMEREQEFIPGKVPDGKPLDAEQLANPPEHTKFNGGANMIAQRGWYTDGRILMKVPDKERAKIAAMPEAAKEGRIPAYENTLELVKNNDIPGEIIAGRDVGVGSYAPMVLYRTADGELVAADANYIKTVTKRYPEAKPFFGKPGNYSDPIAFKNPNGEVVGVVCVLDTDRVDIRIRGESQEERDLRDKPKRDRERIQKAVNGAKRDLSIEFGSKDEEQIKKVVDRLSDDEKEALYDYYNSEDVRDFTHPTMVRAVIHPTAENKERAAKLWQEMVAKHEKVKADEVEAKAERERFLVADEARKKANSDIKRIEGVSWDEKNAYGNRLTNAKPDEIAGIVEEARQAGAANVAREQTEKDAAQAEALSKSMPEVDAIKEQGDALRTSVGSMAHLIGKINAEAMVDGLDVLESDIKDYKIGKDHYGDELDPETKLNDLKRIKEDFAALQKRADELGNHPSRKGMEQLHARTVADPGTPGVVPVFKKGKVKSFDEKVDEPGTIYGKLAAMPDGRVVHIPTGVLVAVPGEETRAKMLATLLNDQGVNWDFSRIEDMGADAKKLSPMIQGFLKGQLPEGYKQPEVKAASKEPHEMTKAEHDAAIETAEKAQLGTVSKEDWGNLRGQGKRHGHMVMGGMRDSSLQGEKSYANIVGQLPEEQQSDVHGLHGVGQVAYLQARGAGFDHDHALSVALEKQGETNAEGKPFEAHRAAVEDAKAAGKSVPPEVLADYPDLAKPALPPEVAAAAAEKAAKYNATIAKQPPIETSSTETPNAEQPAIAAERAGDAGPATELGRPGGGVAHGDDGQGRREPARPRIVTVRPEYTKAANPELVPEALRRHLISPDGSTHQLDGAALAIDAMTKHGGFLNADGTGAGKTRQELAVGQHFADKGKKVVIVSQAEVIKPDWNKGAMSGSFAADSATMGIKAKLIKGDAPLTSGSIHITTYNELGKLKGQVDKDTVLLFDESHSMKNPTSARSKHGKDASEKAHAVGYFTATPADKAIHIPHLFRAGVFGTIGKTKTFEKLGMKLVPHPKRDLAAQGASVGVDPKIGSTETFRRISGLFDQMTKDGLMVKRELSMDGVEVGINRIELSDQQHHDMDQVFEDVLAKTNGNKAVALMAARLHQEPFKIPHTVEAAKKELAQGRSVVIFCGRVNDIGMDDNEDDQASAALSETGHESVGTAKGLKAALLAAGIPANQIGELHGGATKTAAQKKKAMEDFQSGKTQIIIATIQSGGTGINLDDTTGKRPRSMFVMTPPFTANDMTQATGRIVRLNTKSSSRIYGVLANTAIDDWNASILADKFRVMGAVVGGESTRSAAASRPPEAAAIEEPNQEPYAWGESLAGGATGPAATPHYHNTPFAHNGIFEKFGGKRTKQNGDWTTKFPSKEHFDKYKAHVEELDAKRRAEQAATKPSAPTVSTPVAPEPHVTEDQRAAIHQALKMLAGNDTDRARERNAVGFNQNDSEFGAKLAETEKLSDRQAAAAAKLLAKYHRQVPADLLAKAVTFAEPPKVAEKPTAAPAIGKTPKGYFVGGKTYDNKDQIKAAGGRWDADRKQWFIPAAAKEKLDRVRGLSFQEQYRRRQEPMSPIVSAQLITDAVKSRKISVAEGRKRLEALCVA